MTITITWWAIPVALCVIGVFVAFVVGSRGGNYDFVTPLIAAAIFFIFIAAAIGITAGHFL